MDMINFGFKQPEYLSFGQALEAALAGKRVRHESWNDGSYLTTDIGGDFVRMMNEGYMIYGIRIGTYMLTGWIVLDR